MRQNMEFDEFADFIAGEVCGYLPEPFRGVDISLRKVMKNNGMELTGLVIGCNTGNVCPMIYLEPYFKAYKAGKDPEAILMEIAAFRVRYDFSASFDPDRITDFERARNIIVPRLVNLAKNRTVLAERPHSILTDLAVTYHIPVSIGTASVPITCSLAEKWGVGTEELHALAVRNMSRLLPGTFRGANAVVNDAREEDIAAPAPEDEPFFVLSNEHRWYGATVILDDAFMKTVADQLGSEFYILPCNVHQLLAMSADSETDAEDLKGMVATVNFMTVAPEDRLSNNVYRYIVGQGLRLA